MTLRNVPKSFTLEEQRQEVNEIAVDLDTAVDGVQTFSGDKTFSDNVTFSTDVTFQAQTFWGDGDQAVFGADSDMLLYHTGLVGLLENTTGDFYLRSGVGTAIHIEPAAGADSIIANAGGNVELYYNADKKIETTLTGATVLGDLDLNGDLDVQDYVTLCSTSGNVILGSSTNSNANLSIYAGTSPGFTNYFQLRASSNEAYITNTSGSGGGGGINIEGRSGVGLYGGGYLAVRALSDGSSSLLWQTSSKLDTTTTGVSITGNIDTVTGISATGTVSATNFSGPVTGNADTATALETARTIAGQSFDGTANITIAATDLSDTDQALSTTSDVTFNSVATSGGLSTQFLKADGTVDSSTYLTTETDPVFSASEAASITSTDTTNWDTAYGWGDHSTEGYLTVAAGGTAPTTATDPGTPGEIRYDADFIYICIAIDTWKRAPIAAW